MKPTFKKYVLLSILMIIATAAMAGSIEERRFIWNEANSIMTSARTQKDYIKASEVYRKLIDAGVNNNHLFYNLGTAYLNAGEHSLAISSLKRAERYRGGSHDISRNMQIAASRSKTSLEWYRPLLFWHFGLSARARMHIAITAYVLMWIAILLRRFNQHHLSAPLLLIALTALFLFGSSVATSLQSESRDHEQDTARRRSLSTNHQAENN